MKRGIIQKPKGTKDIYGAEALLWEHIERKAREIFKLYGFKEMRTPIFETTELFERGIGEETEVVKKEMYTFSDRGGRSITLRPENTAPVVRAVIENKLYEKPPLRFFYIGPMFRYDRPQKGRFRQFHQIGIEILGEDEPSTDAEVIEMAFKYLESLPIKDFKILINSIGCRKCRPGYLSVLTSEAEKIKDKLCEDCKVKVYKNPLRIFDCKNEKCIEESAGLPKINQFLCDDCKEHFNEVIKILDWLEIPYQVEPRLVRGLDYYTKTTFEIVPSSFFGSQSSILGGGRYDELMDELGGPHLSGIGFALGVERTASLLSSLSLTEEEKIMVIPLSSEEKKEALILAKGLRDNGFIVIFEHKIRNIRTSLSWANKAGIEKVIIIGEKEKERGTVVLKNMLTGEQREIKKEDIVIWLNK
ncbi:MAG: histidine--tRNA ligase [Candidatus Aminicenantia bacterium]